ncbi:2453_t:CDS:1, partial [Dentiscutata heterogama]
RFAFWKNVVRLSQKLHISRLCQHRNDMLSSYIYTTLNECDCYHEKYLVAPIYIPFKQTIDIVKATKNELEDEAARLKEIIRLIRRQIKNI